ncbi:MAG: radical SAM protein [Candidatus Pacearchaeota archaeon]
MEINNELFVIPDEDKFILYVPLEGSVVSVSSGVVGALKKIKKGEESSLQPEIKEQLIKTKILVESQSSCNIKKEGSEYEPTSITLMPTYNCNLRCVYCYSHGGERVGQIMEFDVAKSAIDLVVKNSLKVGNKDIHLGFHGGGEPLLRGNIDFLKRSVEYFNKQTEKNNLKGRVSSATNGVFNNLNHRDLEWILKNIDRLNISLDGTADIQDAQRPMAGPNHRFMPSSDYVVETIKILEEEKYPYGIRATITAESVPRMSEILEFFHSISSNKSFHLEPLFECGRCKTTKARAPSPEDYLKYLLEAKQTAEKLEVGIYYSGAKLEGIHNSFCGAAGKNFLVSPEGRVTTCLEVSRKDDDMAEIFIVGQYNPDKNQFEFDDTKIKRLQGRVVENIPNCRDCFAKYNCGGDCLAKGYAQSRSLEDTINNSRCSINQGILFHEIKQKLKGGQNGKQI